MNENENETTESVEDEYAVPAWYKRDYGSFNRSYWD